MVLLLLLLIPLRGVFSDMTLQSLSATSGGSILFQINLARRMEINSVFWSKEKNMVAIVKPDSVKVLDSKFLNRVDFEQTILSLKLSNLSEEDNGIYQATIYTTEDTIKVSFILQVNDKNKSHGVQWTGCSLRLVISLGTLAIFLSAMT
ncbi:T-lymphocyte surface antigen Ly-9-like [Leptodactylus fuscus]|uniref:T-lymphocyte surface antigen Ly-9-like n=1 Tax=Leptodactylus fuscus TaxID=238119 RepID=UPI003F4EE1E3